MLERLPSLASRQLRRSPQAVHPSSACPQPPAPSPPRVSREHLCARPGGGVRGVKVVQRLQLSYEWKYLFLVVDFVRGWVGVDVDGLDGF